MALLHITADGLSSGMLHVGDAGELRLDGARFAYDLEEEHVHACVRADAASAEASGAQAIPKLTINGRQHIGPHDAARLTPALEADLAPTLRRTPPAA